MPCKPALSAHQQLCLLAFLARWRERSFAALWINELLGYINGRADQDAFQGGLNLDQGSFGTAAATKKQAWEENLTIFKMRLIFSVMYISKEFIHLF